MTKKPALLPLPKFESILEWFSGKAHDTIISFTIPALVESEQLGYWKKGVARTVRAKRRAEVGTQSRKRAWQAHIRIVSHAP